VEEDKPEYEIEKRLPTQQPLFIYKTFANNNKKGDIARHKVIPYYTYLLND
jgi:hypothetical protein